MDGYGLPSLRTRSSHAASECSRCGGADFVTRFGRGRLYWWGRPGPVVRYGNAGDGPRVDVPITCAACGTQHEPRVELPPLEGYSQAHSRQANA